MSDLKVFLTRGQPIHNGHFLMIEKALEMGGRLLIFIGSANAHGTKHDPLSIDERMFIMTMAIAERFPDAGEKIILRQLDDLTTVNNTDPVVLPRWGRYLYGAVVKETQELDFTYITGESRESVEAWFVDVAEHVQVEQLVIPEIPEYLCATLVREAIAAGDREFVRGHCPQIVYDFFDEIRYALLCAPSELR